VSKSLVQSIQSDKYKAGTENQAGIDGTVIQSIFTSSIFVESVLYLAKYLIRFTIVSSTVNILSGLSDKLLLSQSDRVNHDTDVHIALHEYVHKSYVTQY
jgi:hypothetical protein